MAETDARPFWARLFGRPAPVETAKKDAGPPPAATQSAAPAPAPAPIPDPVEEIEASKEMMTRAALTEKIVAYKIMNDVKWSDVATAVGKSKEWTTAALMGQISLTKEQAIAAGNALKLNFSEEEIALLMTVPYRGSLPTAVPTDPLIYRLYEVVNVYGTTMKALIEEEFGDGIMSAIDFTMDISREANPAGDRVKIVLDGKFLPYKSY